MSRKVEVLDLHQLPTDKPSQRVKRSVADLLVRRLLAKRISKFLIQLVEVKPVRPIEAFAQQIANVEEVPETNTRWDWAEPVIARYPARDQTSYGYGIS